MKIERLELWSENIEEQVKFYRDLLELEIKNYTEDSFELILGYSVIKFTYKKQATPYHIAVHIPDKQEEKALEWLKERVTVLKNNNEEIIDFSNWKAMSVYFYDADKNIMEFIARRDLHKPESALFTAKSVVGIAEIGMATKSIKEKFEYLLQNTGLEMYDGSLEKFCAIGDDNGLIIVIDKEQKDWFPTRDEAFASDFRIKFRHESREHHLEFSGDVLKSYSK